VNALASTHSSKAGLKLGRAVRAYCWLSRLGRHRFACVLAIGLFTVGFRLALSAVLPHPQPAGHDEFGYILGADIFAHGRVAEPTHPLWKFFESVFVLSRPAYAPKYPPAQAAFLALGQVLFHDRFYGVLLSVALFSAAVCWMLQVYVRPAWALLGGICTALYFGAGHYWTESYWGGAVAGLGAALLVGAFGRLRKERSVRSAAALGFGALLLITSRPYESSILIVLVSSALIPVVWKGWRASTLRAALPILASLAIGPIVVLAYNYGVTGNPLKLPYVLHMEQYGTIPVFWFQDPLLPKHFENAGIQAISEGVEIPAYKEIRSFPPLGRLGQNLMTIFGTILFDGGGLGLAPLVFLPIFRRDSTVRLFTWCAGLLILAVLLETYLFLHYLAPLIVVGTLLGCMMLDRLWKRRKTSCRDRVVLVGVLSAMMLVGPAWRAVQAMGGHPGQLYTNGGFGLRRAEIAQSILKQPGSHVVFVHYNPEQSPNVAWVANGADIDGARLIWAHDRGAENRELQEYFKGRTFWRLEDRAGKVTLVPYPSAIAERGPSNTPTPPAR
jgi:hypothetical protein